MIKILILFAIVLLSGALGIALSAEKKRQVKVFAQFYEFNEQLLMNMKYGREKLDKVAQDYDYVLKVMRGEKVLRGAEGDFLLKYVDGIGETDSLSQVDYLNEKKVALTDYKNKSEENFKKYGTLYFTLSLMAGILIAVLLA